MRLLVTGGCGYVGSCTARALAAAGHAVTVADDCSAGHRAAIPGLPLIEADLATDAGAARALAAAPFDAVLHFVGRISVRESFDDPAGYRRANLGSTECVLRAMRAAGVRQIIFSSTAAVYGTPDAVPIPEHAALRPGSPYGETKLAVEHALAAAAREWGLAAVALRYFNAAGAESATHGEDHHPEEHLIPRVLAAARRGEPINVNGTDYPTPDGTAVRDYVHVRDLAAAHVRALAALAPATFEAINVGSGRGSSILEVLAAAERAVGRPIAWTAAPRRRGDPPQLVADIARAAARLAWRPARDLDAVVASAWAWHTARPAGYGD